jgi:hypothetical protein
MPVVAMKTRVTKVRKCIGRKETSPRENWWEEDIILIGLSLYHLRPLPYTGPANTSPSGESGLGLKAPQACLGDELDIFQPMVGMNPIPKRQIVNHTICQ